MIDDPIAARHERLSCLAADVLGDHGLAHAWLGGPLAELGGLTPLEAGSTEAGAARVGGLLLALSNRQSSGGALASGRILEARQR